MIDCEFFDNYGVDGFWLTDDKNIGYLTDFWGSFGRVLAKCDECTLISDKRYSLQAQCIADKQGFFYREITPSKTFLSDLFIEKKIKTIGIESNDMTVQAYEYLKSQLGDSIKIVLVEDLASKLRTQKSEQEIEKIKKSAQINDEVLSKVIPLLKEGVSEKEIAWQYEKIAKEEYEVSNLSFDAIVAFGTNSASAHHAPSDKKLEKNMPILIDSGVEYERYASDMTRCFFYGTPSNKWVETYKKVLTAQQKGIEEMKIGNEISSVEKAARDFFGEEEKYFGHSFGHGVGLNVHESPTVSMRTKGVFKEYMVVTAEPGLYYPDEFGIRIEDLILISQASPLSISQYSKDMQKMIIAY